MNPEEIRQDWQERGFSFGVFRDPLDESGQIPRTKPTNWCYLRRGKSKSRLKARPDDPKLERRSSSKQKPCTP